MLQNLKKLEKTRKHTKNWKSQAKWWWKTKMKQKWKNKWKKTKINIIFMISSLLLPKNLIRIDDLPTCETGNLGTLQPVNKTWITPILPRNVNDVNEVRYMHSEDYPHFFMFRETSSQKKSAGHFVSISLWFSPRKMAKKLITKPPKVCGTPRFGSRPPSLGVWHMAVGGKGHVFRSTWCLRGCRIFEWYFFGSSKMNEPKSEMKKAISGIRKAQKEKSRYFVSIGERQFLFHDFLRSKNVNLWARRSREDGYGCPLHSWNSPGKLKRYLFVRS